MIDIKLYENWVGGISRPFGFAKMFDSKYKITNLIKPLNLFNFSRQEYVAIKIVKASYMFKNVALDEINLLKCVKEKDPNAIGYDKIILLHEFFTAVSMNGSHICLTFELMGPSLLDLIIQSDYQGLELPAVISIVKQVCIF